MKKIIRLTESDLTRIVKRVIQEQATPGIPIPGKPTPAKPIPGKPTPAKPIPGKPTPAKPTSPTNSKPQTINQKSPTFWDDLINKSFKFPFQLNLYDKRNNNKFLYQVTVTGMKYSGNWFILDIERSSSLRNKEYDVKGKLYISSCNDTYFSTKLQYPNSTEPEVEVVLNDEFLLYFRDKLCIKSQYNSDELVPQVGPGGFGSVNRNNSDRYTA